MKTSWFFLALWFNSFQESQCCGVAEPFIACGERSGLWRFLLVCRAGMWHLPVSWDLIQGWIFYLFIFCLFVFVFIFSAGTPMPGLGHKLQYSLGVFWGTRLAPTMPFSAAAILAANLILIFSLLCFWQSKFPTQAWEFNISTFAWLIRFVSLLWRHCFYGKLMDSHVVFLMAETTPLPPFHPRAQRGNL